MTSLGSLCEGSVTRSKQGTSQQCHQASPRVAALTWAQLCSPEPGQGTCSRPPSQPQEAAPENADTQSHCTGRRRRSSAPVQTGHGVTGCISLFQQLPCSRDTQVLACLPRRVNSPRERDLEAPPCSHCSGLSSPYK